VAEPLLRDGGFGVAGAERAGGGGAPLSNGLLPLRHRVHARIELGAQARRAGRARRVPLRALATHRDGLVQHRPVGWPWAVTEQASDRARHGRRSGGGGNRAAMVRVGAGVRGGAPGGRARPERNRLRNGPDRSATGCRTVAIDGLQAAASRRDLDGKTVLLSGPRQGVTSFLARSPPP
jgi:hypothetical protein